MLKNMKLAAFSKTASLRAAAKQKVSTPALSTSGRTRSTSTPFPSSHVRVKQQVDEAFQQRLAGHLAVLDATAAGIKATFDGIYSRGVGTTLGCVEAKSLYVGRAFSMSHAKVDMCSDRLDYNFTHATEGKVHMIMWYKDINCAELDMRSRLFKYHVTRPLTPHFPGEYDPAGAQGVGQAGSLSMVLSSPVDAACLAELLQPLLPCLRIR